MTMTNPSKGTLLIIEDVPDNVKILLNFLSAAGFKVLIAKDGEQGLKVAEYAHPDVILLDVMMPGMNGFKVCKKLKANAETKDIPVIFMTALSDTIDKVKGFEVGAADYLTKPVQQEEVLARITAHLNLRHLQQQLEEQNRQLLSEINLRKTVEASLQEINNVLAARTMELQAQTRALEQRNLELDAFAHTVAHDLKNPLNGIIGITELLKDACTNDSYLDSHWQKEVHLLGLAGNQLANIIDALLLLAGVSRQAQIEIEPLEMSTLINEILERQAAMIEHYQGSLLLPNRWPVAKGYGPWVKEVWINYLSNGLKYGGRPPRLEFGADKMPSTLEENALPPLATADRGRFIRFWVRDNGAGLPPEAQTRLFTPFTRLQKRVEGYGLGLSIVKQIVEKLGGQVGVESVPNQGSLFYFTLPAV